VQNKPDITPGIKVYELLEAYPELEQPLMELAPAFRKLRNPVLRRTIARVTSLQQAAAVGDISVDVLVNRLRSIAGLVEYQGGSENTGYSGDKPLWFDTGLIRKTFDAREIIGAGGHPLSLVMSDLHNWEGEGIYELIAPFMPAPLLDKMRDMGFDVWSKKEEEYLFRNFFRKKN